MESIALAEVIALLLALFMPDTWVLAGVNDNIFIDVVGPSKIFRRVGSNSES